MIIDIIVTRVLVWPVTKVWYQCTLGEGFTFGFGTVADGTVLAKKASLIGLALSDGKSLFPGLAPTARDDRQDGHTQNDDQAEINYKVHMEILPERCGEGVMNPSRADNT